MIYIMEKTTHYVSIYTENDPSLCEFTSQKSLMTTREITTEDTYSYMIIYFKKKATQRKLQRKRPTRPTSIIGPHNNVVSYHHL